MINIPETKLYIGTVKDYAKACKDDFALINTTQTLHYIFCGWNWTDRKPDKADPNYICKEEDNLFSLNWVDGPSHLYEWGGVEAFIKAMDFIGSKLADKQMLIFCNQGLSRAPTLTLVYMAKRLGFLPNESFDAAAKKFKEEFYPDYEPKGIADFVRDNWEQIE